MKFNCLYQFRCNKDINSFLIFFFENYKKKGKKKLIGSKADYFEMNQAEIPHDHCGRELSV